MAGRSARQFQAFLSHQVVLRRRSNPHGCETCQTSASLWDQTLCSPRHTWRRRWVACSCLHGCLAVCVVLCWHAAHNRSSVTTRVMHTLVAGVHIRAAATKWCKADWFLPAVPGRCPQSRANSAFSSGPVRGRQISMEQPLLQGKRCTPPVHTKPYCSDRHVLLLCQPS
jgi:hypothetical protein